MNAIVIFLSFVAIATTSRIPPIPRFPTADSRIDLEGRVVGGSDAAQGAYPFIASLRSASNSHFCGGSIINARYVLTAAHCLYGASASNVRVVVGTNQLLSGGNTYAAVILTLHVDYNDDTIVNDIAVIGLSSSISFSSTVTTTVLGTTFVDTAPATLIGWGRLYTNGPLPNNLQQLLTTIISHNACSAVWGNWVSTNNICAFTSSGVGSCNGDSGGPLIGANTREQIGIVSFGEASGCATGFPDVYVRISAYTSWINSAISG